MWVGIPRTLRATVTFLVALSVPVVPFLVFGDWFEFAAQDWLHAKSESLRTASGIVGLLASDILLPIPSSIVCTYAGETFGMAMGTVVSWTGLTLGTIIGYGLSSWLGAPFVAKFGQEESLRQAEMLHGSSAGWLLALTRALPVLAEAAVLVCGMHRMGWQRMLVATMPANLGLAFAYAALGEQAESQGWLPIAFALAAALPLLLTWLIRNRLQAHADGIANQAKDAVT